MDNDDTVNIVRQGDYSHVLKGPVARERILTTAEKAATFIGWGPDDPCMGGMISADGHCIHGNYGTCEQFAPAPDMTIPNNYMAALMNFPAFDIRRRKDTGEFYIYLEEFESWSSRLLVRPKLPEAIIELLADKYDSRSKK